MNDPNKAISVNLSSLLSLKAELLRKQHEVKLAKAAQVSAGEHKPQKVVSEKEKPKSNSYKEVSRNEDVKVYEEEDHAQLAKSRRVLEAKSKYYDRMSRSGGNLNSDDNCLVMFNRKRQEEDLDDDDEEPQACSPPGRVSSSSSSSSEDEGNDDDEVEYVDCLGRTRKCLRKVLAEEKKRDKQLAHSMPERIDTTKANWMIDTKGDVEEDQESINVKPRPPGSIFSDDQSTATHHAEQLLNWERKEQENAEKPDVHYQDVFFDEARTHGVGYYAFSTDEEERAKQQRELEEARKATTEEQTRRDELRAKRDSMVAGRVLAAKNRIRARSGLPPISKEDYERELQQKKDESAAEAVERERKEREKKEALEKAREAEEAERAELRKDYVRDWDKEKLAEESDEEWEYKAERLPMSQAQWNDKQRAERREEFAPLPEPLKRSNFSSIPEPPPMWDIPEQEFSNFNSSKKQQQQQFQRRNYTTPSDDIDDDAPSTSSGSRGAAIPPPPGLNDMGPPAAKVSRTQNELERSIEAGLKFLRNCCDKEAITSKASWTAKADY